MDASQGNRTTEEPNETDKNRPTFCRFLCTDFEILSNMLNLAPRVVSASDKTSLYMWLKILLLILFTSTGCLLGLKKSCVMVSGSSIIVLIFPNSLVFSLVIEVSTHGTLDKLH